MKMRRPFAGTTVLLPGILAVTTFFAGCDQSKQPTTPAASAAPISAQKVFIQFEGPWAFAPDPKDANMVLAIAPKAKGHRDLFVKASNTATLASGTYDLAVPPRTGTASATLDAGIAQAKNDAAIVQRAFDAKGSRYAIRVPKPEAYVAAGRFRSRVGPTYPPDATTEKDYATEVSLVYTVSSRSGFSLSGALDSGTFNPLLLQIESPIVRFVIEPDQYDDPADLCNLHSRASFQDLTKLLNLTLYVDFPNDPAECHKKDPQNPYPGKAADGSASARDRFVAALGRNSAEPDVREATVARAGITLGNLVWLAANGRWNDFRQNALVAIYWFSHSSMDCRAPVIVLGS
jgi:hypothetical protein